MVLSLARRRQKEYVFRASLIWVSRLSIKKDERKIGRREGEREGGGGGRKGKGGRAITMDPLRFSAH